LCGQAMQIDHVQRWLTTRCQRAREPPALSKVVHLTPLLQRRLLWGDARTTPALIDSLTAELEAHRHPREEVWSSRRPCRGPRGSHCTGAAIASTKAVSRGISIRWWWRRCDAHVSRTSSV
jgi:hypothetical protein